MHPGAFLSTWRYNACQLSVYLRPLCSGVLFIPHAVLIIIVIIILRTRQRPNTLVEYITYTHTRRLLNRLSCLIDISSIYVCRYTKLYPSATFSSTRSPFFNAIKYNYWIYYSRRVLTVDWVTHVPSMPIIRRPHRSQGLNFSSQCMTNKAL